MHGFRRREKVLPMSSENTAIRASGLGKCYHVYQAPADRLKQFLLPRLQSRLGRRPSLYYKEFWALSSVSFDIRKGETIGIVGRNGSGKSTLLQMISGTLTPTTGTVETNGRVAALLELGSGFNPEYTGRENVYMNCAVLGLSRSEIDERFESIVDFSEIRDFIDQPVKNYSSGMFARLAFSAAIHVEPEILVVDEALSVGDFAFQLKCVRRLKELAESGCTILFVTHDIEQVQKLCRRALYLRDGKAVFFGEARLACEQYLADVRVGSEPSEAAPSAPVLDMPAIAKSTDTYAAFAQHVERFRRGARRQGEIVHVTINGMDLSEPSVPFGSSIRIGVIFRLMEQMECPTIAVYVTDETGQMIVGTNTTNESIDLKSCRLGVTYELCLSFENRLRTGRFALQVFLGDVIGGIQTEYVDYLDMAVPFRSVATDEVQRWAWYTPPFDAKLQQIPGGYE